MYRLANWLGMEKEFTSEMISGFQFALDLSPIKTTIDTDDEFFRERVEILLYDTPLDFNVITEEMQELLIAKIAKMYEELFAPDYYTFDELGEYILSRMIEFAKNEVEELDFIWESVISPLDIPDMYEFLLKENLEADKYVPMEPDETELDIKGRTFTQLMNIISFPNWLNDEPYNAIFRDSDFSMIELLDFEQLEYVFSTQGDRFGFVTGLDDCEPVSGSLKISKEEYEASRKY